MLLIDEAQANNEELKKLIVAYQEMVGAGRDVFVVLAGLPETISSVLNDRILTFLNRATKVELKPLKTADVEAYYQNTFKNIGIELKKDTAHILAVESSGSPYLMQLIGHYITIFTEKKGIIREDIITKAVNYAREDYKNDICRTTIASLSDRDMDFLAAMSEDEDDSLISDIISRLGCTSAYVQTYKRRLIQSGVISQPRRGKVRMTVPYLREYVREQI